jgi:mono/diheme cytochrome c family protein
VRKWIALGASGLLLTALASGSGAAADGKALFVEKCATCHGETGNADTKKGKAAKAKSFHETEIAAKLTAADGEAVVTKHVRTHKKHKNVNKKVTDEELATIAAYVKVLVAKP